MKAVLTLVALATSTAAFAAVSISDESSEWAKTAKPDGMGVIYVHRSTVEDKKAALSSVSIYRIPAADPDIVKYRATFGTIATLQKQFAPEKCFKLNRTDLETRQTWCESGSKWMFVMAELGPEQMSETEKSEKLFEFIGETAK